MILPRPAGPGNPAPSPPDAPKAAGSFHRFPRCPCVLRSASSAPDAPARCRISSPAFLAPQASAYSSRCRTAHRTCSQSARAPNPESARSSSIGKVIVREVAPFRLRLAPRPAAPFPSRLPQRAAATPPLPYPVPPARPPLALLAAAAMQLRELAPLPAFAEPHLAKPAPPLASCAPRPLWPLPPPRAPDPPPAGASPPPQHWHGPSPRGPAPLFFPQSSRSARLLPPSASPPLRALPLPSPPLRAPRHPLISCPVQSDTHPPRPSTAAPPCS